MSRGRPMLESFGTLMLPTEAAEPILAKSVRAALLEWLTEVWEGEALKAVGLEPRKRAIFDGLPGTGKTTLAHHLAARLGLPMLAVRPEAVIDKYVGSTGQNIGALFEAANREDEPVVLFLDEFDTIGQKRGEASSGAESERNNSTNTLLQAIDRHDGFIIAATNYSETVDPAVWRRFDMHITLELPGQFERERIIARYMAPYALPQEALVPLGQSMAGASPALIRQFCEGLKRGLVIGPKVGWDMTVEGAFSRLLNSIQPHPEMSLPPLWVNKTANAAVKAMPWPPEKEGAA